MRFVRGFVAQQFGTLSRAFVRTSAIVVIGNLIYTLIGVVALRLYTELAPQEIFGTGNLALGALTLGFQLVVQPVLNVQIRYHTEANRQGRGDAATRQSIIWTLGGAALLVIPAAVTAYLWFQTDWPTWAALAVAWIVLSALRQVFLIRLHAEQRMGLVLSIRVLEALLVTLATVGALLLAVTAEVFVGAQVVAFAGVIAATALLAPWPTLRLLVGRPAGEPPPGFTERLRRYGLPFAPAAVLNWLNNLGDRYVLASLLGAGAAGHYLAAYSIASRGYIMAGGALSDLLRPKLFDAESAGDYVRADRIFRAWLAAYFGIGLLGFAAIVLLGRWIAALLLAPAYREGAVTIMLWIAVAYFLAGVTQTLENRLFSLGHSVRLLWPLALGAVASIAGSFVFISWHGVFGAAQGSCFGFAVQCAATAYVLWHALHERREADDVGGMA